MKVIQAICIFFSYSKAALASNFKFFALQNLIFLFGHANVTFMSSMIVSVVCTMHGTKSP